MSKEELAQAYLSQAFDSAVEKVGAVTVAKSLVSDAQKPVASIYIGMSGEREIDDWRHDLPVGRNQLYTEPPKLTPPDGWAEGLTWAMKIKDMEGHLALSLAAMSKAIRDMDALLKEVKP
jgi:hypothetical protein